MLQKRSCLLALVIVSSFLLPARAGEIHSAAQDGKLEEVKHLLDKDPGLLNATDELGATPLIWACARNHTHVARYLVERGADVSVKGNSQITALHIAALRGNPELLALLLTNGADPEVRTQHGQTVLHWAVNSGDPEIIRRLLVQKVLIDAQDKVGNTPLLRAALWGAEEVVRVLVKNHADVNQENNRGSTPLSVARREGLQAIADYLVAHGARVSGQQPPLPKGEYLGQAPPGLVPQVFAPGIVSTEKEQLNAAFTPDGEEFFFAVAEPGRGHRMYHMVQEESGWTGPEPVPFASPSSDVDMFVTHDGQRLFFCSTRPAPRKPVTRRDADIFVVAKTESGWSEPVSLGEAINSNENDYYPTLTKEGALYFSSHRAGGFGQNDIYRSRLVDGRYQEPENTGQGFNTPHREFDPFIAPDESYLIFASDRPGGFGDADLYISFRQENGTWSPPTNMGKTINSSASDYTPMLSPDGKYLFFTSNRAGVSDLYWADARVIHDLRPDPAPPPRGQEGRR